MHKDLKIFKFGGASVRDAESVRNVARIIDGYGGSRLVVVVSAMGKSTNALEAVVREVVAGNTPAAKKAAQVVVDFHRAILEEIFPRKHFVWQAVDQLIQDMDRSIREADPRQYGATYDRIVPFGEWLSTTIVHAFLSEVNSSCKLLKAAELIVTNNNHRRATVDFAKTLNRAREAVRSDGVYIIQGFIGATENGIPTTLGREGSDYTAAVMAYVLEASEVSIWKDVPGVLSGDPRFFDEAVLLERISYREAIELAYYGASVIHPKTIQPLKYKNIPLRVRSFLNPDQPGTIIREGEALVPQTPCFIRKENQILITLSTDDLAFIVEDHLSIIYRIFHEAGIAVNLMQKSAVSTLFSVNNDPILIPGLLVELGRLFEVRHNDNMTLYTIRHYTEASVREIEQRGEVYLEQVTRHTRQMVLLEKP